MWKPNKGCSSPVVNQSFLIVGLGNPGPRFVGTRHNVGFDWVLNVHRHYSQGPFKDMHNAWIAAVQIEGVKGWLMLPQTYMNLSGEAVVPFVHTHQIDLDRVLIVYDDVALPLGRMRFRDKGSHGGHNGMRNIIEVFGQEAIPRLKIGVGPQPGQPLEGDLVDFVLGHFEPAELQIVEKVLENGPKAARMWLLEDVHHLMATINGFRIQVPHDGS